MNELIGKKVRVKSYGPYGTIMHFDEKSGEYLILTNKGSRWETIDDFDIIKNYDKKDLNYLKMVLLTAESSKCLKAKYGSIIVSKDDRVISTGRNGKPRGSINDDICFRMGEERDDSHSCCVHSERNCIMFANPIEREGGTIYVSGIPCKDCALAIMNSGLARGVFLQESHSVTGLRVSTEEFWNLYGSKIERIYVARKELENG